MTTPILTQACLARARQFLEQQGRSLEAARFHHGLDGASAEFVMAALKGFQNSDGGFGHGLEPDLRTEESSVLCTSVAFQVLRSISPEALLKEDWVAGAIAYLLATLDRQEWHWPIIPPSAQRSPRAPW